MDLEVIEMSKKKKSNKNYLFYDPIYKTLLTLQNQRGGKEISDFQGLQVREKDDGKEVAVSKKGKNEESL